MVRVWFDMLTRGNARRLAKWWNAHSKASYQEFEVRRSPTNRRYWALYRV